MGSHTRAGPLMAIGVLLVVGCAEKSNLPPISSVPADLRPYVSGLLDKNPDMRWQAARELGLLGSQSAPAVPYLTAALQDREPKVRLWSTLALAEIGPLAHKASPELKELREAAEAEGNKELEKAANRALLRINGE